MCGIAGIFNLDQKPVDKKTIERMIKIMKYRGPDDEGYFIDNNIGLGHCRLSIIDLSTAGHQPMSDEDQNLWIIHNGEIYNFIELRNELEELGYRFKSNTDTEVILYSYKQWQEECLKKFNGMWAFAIWDAQRKELFCARDRFGIKPFYYFFDGKTFAFASEIKSLLEFGVLRKPNNNLIYDFIKFGILDHNNSTFFENINKLPASNWLKINLNGKFKIQKYWDFEVIDEIGNSNKNIQKQTEHFLNLFYDSVRLRLRSDVPVGSCLSGGLDSSSIVCVINDLLRQEKILNIGEHQKTFSSCFDIKRFDERNYIEEVILKIKAEKNYVFPTAEGFLKELDNLLWHQEEPFAGTSVYAQWLVLKEAKKRGITVILDGQGGDEIMCGYRKFYFFYLKKLWDNKQFFLFTKEFLKFFSSLSILKTIDIKNGLKYFKFTNKLLNIDNLLNPNFLIKNFKNDLSFGYDKNLGKRIKEDITKWSLPVLLRYEDKNSMAHSIEARLPLLDYRLVELLGKFPLSQKMKNGLTKFVLRESMKGILPNKIRLRKSKIGFDTPEDIWFRNNLKENIKLTFKGAIFIPDYADVNKLIDYFNKFISYKTIFKAQIFFRFYILELWARKFILNNYGK